MRRAKVVSDLVYKRQVHLVLGAAPETEAAPARLSPVPVDAVTITATLNDDPLITAEKSQSVWGSGQIAMSGQVPPADAPALREAWEDGLKDARVAISLTISGAEPALVATDDTSVLSFDFGASHLRLAHATQSVASSQSAAGTRTLTYTQEISPGRRAAKKKIILTDTTITNSMISCSQKSNGKPITFYNYFDVHQIS